MKYLLYFIAAYLALAIMSGCSTSWTPTEVAGDDGSGSVTTNGISATAVYPNGTPAAQAVVRLRTADYLADTLSVIGKRRARPINLLTDDSGSFVIDSLDTGAYRLEISDASGNAASVPCTVVAHTTRDLGSIVINPPAVIQGIISGAYASVYVRVRGLERVLKTTNGAYQISVPSGSIFTVSAQSADTTIEQTLANPIEPWQHAWLSFDLGTHAADSLFIRSFLDDAGLGGVNVADVATIDSATGRLRHLNLSSRNLTSIPASIADLQFIWNLDIGHNPLATVPPQIGDIVGLGGLSLAGIRMDSLPAFVTGLQSLQWLNLDSTGLTDLPASMSTMPLLASLTMAHNNLASVPVAVFAISGLGGLSLENNALTSIPAEIGNLRNLEHLGINNNQITRLPPEIGLCVNLQALYAYDNLIDSLPAEIGNLTSLTMLHLERNKLTYLPQEIGQCVALESIYIGDNLLTSLPASITNLTPARISVFGNMLCPGTLPADIETWLDTYSYDDFGGNKGAIWRSLQVGCQ